MNRPCDRSVDSSASLRLQHGPTTAILCGLALVLSGCCIPNLRCPEAGRSLPGDFRGVTTADNSADIGIDEFFDDPVLTRLICEGLASNQELKIRNQEILIASNEIMARKGAYFPFVFLRGATGFDKTSRFTPLGAAEEQLTYPGGKNFPSPLPDTVLSADLVWRLDIWRELRNARDAAIQRYVEAIEARDYFVTKLVAEIAENYYDLAALDKRLEFLNQTIELQQHSLEVAKFQKEAARGTELGVQRFLAEVRKNESERLIVRQRIIEVENQINFLVGRYPQFVDRQAWDYINLDSRTLSVGVPAQLLLNRRDVRAAERELAATGLDVASARARFFPQLNLRAGIGFEAFNPKYLFDPGAFIANTAGELVAPLINRAAIKADYLNANARQLQAAYEYQRTLLNAFTEVVNRMTKVENYRRSVEVKEQQVQALEQSVDIASQLFQNARAEYMDVLFSQRDMLEARVVLIETKQQQLTAIVSTYQALGGGYLLSSSGKTFSELYCPPMAIHPDDVGLPLAPGEPNLPAPAGKASLFVDPAAEPPPATQEPPAASDEDNPQSNWAPGGAAPFPVEGVPLPASYQVTPLFGSYDDRQASYPDDEPPREAAAQLSPFETAIGGSW